MMRDPFYRQIIARLEGLLDPELFEQCASDILRSIYPTLVPIRGGGDSGMDGAIADGEGEPFPLVCTTSERVLGNLKSNLQKYLDDGGKRRKAVLATSQQLTPRRRQNLFGQASELGFTLIGVHDQAAIANLLYYNPAWCRELLGLTGNPPALSVVPKTERPWLGLPLIGREPDLTWLREKTGDRLLVGQPGSGKTYLFHMFAIEGGGLFAVTVNRVELASAIRSEQPQVIIVDDAHVPTNRELLRDLRQMREELGANYSILASCWPSHERDLISALNLPFSQVLHLERLARDEIVEVVKAVGIHSEANALLPLVDPRTHEFRVIVNPLIREIVNQAEGRPGLAVTLTHLCLQGGAQQIATGDALTQIVLGTLAPSLDRHPKEILAAFAIGGDAGMAKEAVREILELDLLDVIKTTTNLGTSGVMLEIDRQHLAVSPPALRFALVRDVFFSGPSSLGLEYLIRLVEAAPQLSEVVRTLIGAAARGADIPRDLFTQMLKLLDEQGMPWRTAFGGRIQLDQYDDIWRAHAWLGSDQASWILENYPERLITIAHPALDEAPQITIPLLLQAAISDKRELHPFPDHPMRIIADWIKNGFPGTGEPVRRRRVLFEAVRSWLVNENHPQVGLTALQYVVFPGFEDNYSDPGGGNTVTLRHGYLLPNELRDIQDLWPGIVEMISAIQVSNWKPIQEVIEEWAYPGRTGVSVTDDTPQEMRSFAIQMLTDVMTLTAVQHGVQRWIKQVAQHLDWEIPIPIDPDFETLYPLENLQDWEESERQQLAAVRGLAEKWCELEPQVVALRLKEFEQEAQSANIQWPNWTPALCQELAPKVESPEIWGEALAAADLPSNFVFPFLYRAAEQERPGWISLANACLGHPTLRTATISLVLISPDPPTELLQAVLARMEGASELVRMHCVRGEVAEPVLSALLQHVDGAIAGAAALGEWHADPKGSIRTSVREVWENVIVNTLEDDFWLAEIFKTESTLALEWVKRRLSQQPLEMYRYSRTVRSAVQVLDHSARREILQQMPATFALHDVVAELVGDDLDLYAVLLANARLEGLHLAPLVGFPDEIWIEKARLALAAGYGVEQVAHGVHGHYIEWSGSESEMWSHWVERFETLCSHEDEKIRRIGEYGRDSARARQNDALKREKHEAIFGRQ